MQPSTRDAQRAELHKTIWRIANDLRGSVDGWDFKSYVLGMLFYRFISENLTAYVNEQERAAGDRTFNYAAISDKKAELGRRETVAERGFYILPSELFANVRKRADQDENLNMTLERVFKNIEGSAVGTESEADIHGLFDDLDVNSQKLGPTVAKRNEKLVKLLDADLAFAMHILKWLAVNGTAAIVEFPGVLYRSGAEQKIRKYLLDNNYVDAVIQLPPDLFFGATIATCIIVLKKSKQDDAVLFIDASAEFTRVGNKNHLAPEHHTKVLDAYVARQNVDHFAKVVPHSVIAENSYNIAVSSYVEREDTRKEVDIRELNAEIARIVARQSRLRTEIDAIVADLEGAA